MLGENMTNYCLIFFIVTSEVVGISLTLALAVVGASVFRTFHP